MGIFGWSRTPARNGAIETGIAALDGASSRAFPLWTRELMAALRRFSDDQGGALVTEGVLNAYEVRTGSGLSELRSGVGLVLRADRTNTAAPTLNVDGLGPLPWVDAAGAALQAGRVIKGRFYTVFLDPEAPAWRVQAGASTLDEIPGLGTLRDTAFGKANEVLAASVGLGGALRFNVGTGNAFTLTLGMTAPAYFNGMSYRVFSNRSNTAAATLSVDGLPAKPILTIGSDGLERALRRNELYAQRAVDIAYNASSASGNGAFILLNPANVLDFPVLGTSSAAFTDSLAMLKEQVSVGGFYGGELVLPQGQLTFTTPVWIGKPGDVETHIRVRGQGGYLGKGATRIVLSMASDGDVGITCSSLQNGSFEDIEFVSGSSKTRKLLYYTAEVDPIFSGFFNRLKYCSFRNLGGVVIPDYMVDFTCNPQMEISDCWFGGNGNKIRIGNKDLTKAAGGGMGSTNFNRCQFYAHIEFGNAIQVAIRESTFTRVNVNELVELRPTPTDFVRWDRFLMENCSQVVAVNSGQTCVYQPEGARAFTFNRNRLDSYKIAVSVGGEAEFYGNEYLQPPIGVGTCTAVEIRSTAGQVKGLGYDRFGSYVAAGHNDYTDARASTRGKPATFNVVSGYGLLLPQTRQLLNAMEVEPRPKYTRAYDDAIDALIEGGAWDTFSVLYFGCMHSRQAASLNWRNPKRYNLTDSVNPAAWSRATGWTGNSVDARLRTGLLGTALQQDTNWIGVWQTGGTDGQSDAYAPIGQSSLAQFTVNTRSSTGRIRGQNSGPAGLFGVVGTNRGLTVINRSGPMSLEAYRDGVLTGTSAVQSAALTAGEFTLLANTSSYTDAEICLAAVGSQSSTAAHQALIYSVFSTLRSIMIA